MILNLDPTLPATVEEQTPGHINPILWQQSLGLARQICARVFRDGGRPGDALQAFGLAATVTTTWDKAVEMIASELSRSSAPRSKAA